MSEIIDSYSESNASSNSVVGQSGNVIVGQTFSAIAAIIDSTVFYLRKTGIATGNCYSKIYELTGTYGTNSKPTGTAISTSDSRDVSLLSEGLYSFSFSGSNRITLAEGHKYGVSFEYGNGSLGNEVYVAIDTTSASHGGNQFNANSEGTFTTSAANDVCFYVYGITTPEINAKYAIPPFKNVMV